ncbi:MAG: hypothetical protein HY986_16675 [Candidatus Melainabacteria bacterium]|nr:hypothetical protein [Candidatus Melainabacteria bacterium]
MHEKKKNFFSRASQLLMYSSLGAVLALTAGLARPAAAQVAASSATSSPYSANLNNNTNSATVYNVLPQSSGDSRTNVTSLSLTLSFGWSETNVYNPPPVTCPIAVLASQVLTTRIPQGCPIPAVLNQPPGSDNQGGQQR